MSVSQEKLFRLNLLFFICSFGCSINAQNRSQSTTKLVIFDTDGGADDAWALQILLEEEKRSKMVQVLAITTADGNTDVENVIKNMYRILDGVNRTDVCNFK